MREDRALFALVSPLGWSSCLVVIALVSLPAFGSSFVMVDLPGDRSEIGQVFHELAIDFGAKVIDIENAKSADDVKGVIINGASLSLAEKTQHLESAVNIASSYNVPILVIGAAPRPERVPSSAASLLEGFDIRRIDSVQLSSSRYQVLDDRDLAFELAGFSMPLGAEPRQPHRFIGSTDESTRAIVSLSQSEEYPLFVTFQSYGLNLFLLAAPPASSAAHPTLEAAINDNFGMYGSIAIFLRSALGEYTWHTDQHLANFTVDDPWLHEPYGSLSFDKLARLSQVEPFHLTVAFIPWNYDRSEARVVSLFRRHPSIFSISIHGNNHDHEEFREQRTLVQHEGNIQQALARMERFRNLSGLDYDDVMIFPHQIAPNDVVDLLRQYGFLCTANLQNRRRAIFPSGPPLGLWTNFLAAELGVPSLKRELPWITSSKMKIKLFLQQPLLLHGHVKDFADGSFIGAIKNVNRLLPEIRWTSMGDVCKSLYLKKRVSPTHVRVRVYGTQTIVPVVNMAGQSLTFELVDRDAIQIKEVRMNGKTAALGTSTESGISSIEWIADGRDTVELELQYEDQLTELASVSVDRDSMYVSVIRRLSDFRDLTLSKTRLGRQITTSYYSSSRQKKSGIVLFVAAITLALVLFAKYASRRMRQNTEQ